MRRNVIGSLLASDERSPRQIDTQVIPVVRGMRFIVTSDGIHDNLTHDEIEALLAQPHLEQTLISRALERSREAGYKLIDDTQLWNFRAKADDMTVAILSL